MMVSAYGRRFTAWLGIVAMLLLVCAPTVSHFLASTATVAVPICTEAGAPEHSPVVSLLKLNTQQDTSPHQADLEDCGYCGLLTHDAALLSVPPAMPFPLLLVMLALLLPPLRRFTPIGAFPSGQPRAPPRFS